MAVTYESLFEKYKDDHTLLKCKEYARWTFPYLMSDPNLTGRNTNILTKDFQETGGLLVNNLSTKLVKLLFPVQYPFFKAQASSGMEEFARVTGATKEEISKAFAQMEMLCNKRLFLNGGYASLIATLKHLIVTGNAVLFRDSQRATLTTYGLPSFSVLRDGTGTVLDCIVREFLSYGGLPEDIKALLKKPSTVGMDYPVKKFTRIQRTFRGGQEGYEISQELDSLPIGEPSWYPKLLCPFLFPVWNLVPGEHYARGMVEDYAGGFAKLSALSEQATLYAVEAMRVVHLVAPGSGADIDDIATAQSGAWVPGDPQAIQVHESGDFQKLQAVTAMISELVMNLNRAFMYQAEARDSERTTATEIQMQAQEAETALGGVYSTLSGGIQFPLAHILLSEVSPEAGIGVLTGELTPDITVGIPALGRSSDVQNLLMASQELAGIVPIVQIDQRLDPQRIVDIVLAGRSIDPDTIFFTPEELKQRQEAQAQAQQAQMQMMEAQTMADSANTINNIQ